MMELIFFESTVLILPGTKTLLADSILGTNSYM